MKPNFHFGYSVLSKEKLQQSRQDGAGVKTPGLAGLSSAPGSTLASE
jgi:hypothetical protein